MAPKRTLRSGRRRFDSDENLSGHWLDGVFEWMDVMKSTLFTVDSIVGPLFWGFIIATLAVGLVPLLLPLLWRLPLAIMKTTPLMVWVLTPVFAFAIGGGYWVLGQYNSRERTPSRGRTLVAPNEARERLSKLRTRQP